MATVADGLEQLEKKLAALKVELATLTRVAGKRWGLGRTDYQKRVSGTDAANVSEALSFGFSMFENMTPTPTATGPASYATPKRVATKSSVSESPPSRLLLKSIGPI